MILFQDPKKIFITCALFATLLPSFLFAQGLFNNAYCASISSPRLIPAGKAFTAQITMTNTGTKEWVPTAPHRLGSQSGSTWSVTEIDIPFNVPPHSSVTFRAFFRAPLTPGDYSFNWRMREGGRWFGETCIHTISVGESEVTVSTPQAPDEPPSDPGAPVATTRPATAISDTTALLNGAMHPRGVPTAAWFEWGDTPSLGRKTPDQQIGFGKDARNFSFFATDLLPDTRYFFRAVGKNSHGIGQDAIVEFRTLLIPPPAPLPIPTPAPVPARAPLPQPQSRQTPSPQSPVKVSDESENVFVTLSTDDRAPAPGTEVFLVLGYENNRKSVLKDARLRLVLPSAGAQFVTASVLPTAQGQEEIAFRLGEVQPGEVGSIIARVRVGREAKEESALVFRGVLEEANSGGNIQAGETFLALTVGEKETDFGSIAIAFLVGFPLLVIALLIFVLLRMRKAKIAQ